MRTRLQELRKRAGFRSARAFAEEAGIKLGTYTDYEQGRTVMSLERAWQFADILHVSLDELAGREFRPKVNYPDPRQAELNRCWESLDQERQDRLIGTAHDMEAAKRAGRGSVPTQADAG